jgi:hypothetical protein
VPLVVYGAGVQPGIRTERVTPLASAAIMARALDVPPPDGAEYPVPEGLFKALSPGRDERKIGVGRAD